MEQQYAANTGNSVSIQHVNDPAVTKTINGVTGDYQYTMFFTVCYQSCTATNNAIWSAVSNDGVHFLYPQPLAITFPDGSSGADAASVLYSNSSGPSGTTWKLHVSVAIGNTNKIYLVYVNGGRQALQPAQVEFTNPNGGAQNPNQIYFNNQYYMFFNQGNQYGGYDIYYTTSPDDVSWGPPQGLVINDNNNICSTTTPAGLAASTNLLYLYFSLIDSGAPCNLSENTAVTLWQFQF